MGKNQDHKRVIPMNMTVVVEPNKFTIKDLKRFKKWYSCPKCDEMAELAF
jgi:hypothetical protein